MFKKTLLRTPFLRSPFLRPPFLRSLSKQQLPANALQATHLHTPHLHSPSQDPTETHYNILKLGVSIWNEWRASEPFTIPNLRNTDLRGFHLENINFCRADLQGANLAKAYLYEADFQEANLRKANLTRAGLIGANLHKANLSGAVMQCVYLAQSDLSNANLTGAYLQKADLTSALLTHAVLVNANITEADFTTSLDLTIAQIICAKGCHLASFDNALNHQLAQTRAEDPGKKRAQPTSGADNSQPMKGFEPSVTPTLTPLQPHPRGLLHTRRNAAIANIGLP